PDTRVSRLLVVERDIRENEQFGSPNSTSKWIEAELVAAAVNIGKGALLYLSSGPSWYFALAGSSKHLFGSAVPESVNVPFSFLPTIAEQLTLLDEKRHESLHLIPER